ncbi:MAG: hypothetical protein DI535_19575 [Citrobacter freundii]|nr:MAG: hypothetical protein DI535_19575 [Citrobacter freundii]
MNYLRIYEAVSGGLVDIHPLHGRDELLVNLKAARILADCGYKIELLPSIPATEVEKRAEWLWDVFGDKNPDVRIDGHMIGDIKTPVVAIRQSSINRCIYACAKQKVSVSIINLLGKKYALHDIRKGIIGALQPGRNKTVKEVWIITSGGNLFKVDRGTVFDESIYAALNYL